MEPRKARQIYAKSLAPKNDTRAAIAFAQNNNKVTNVGTKDDDNITILKKTFTNYCKIYKNPKLLINSINFCKK